MRNNTVEGLKEELHRCKTKLKSMKGSIERRDLGHKAALLKLPARMEAQLQMLVGKHMEQFVERAILPIGTPVWCVVKGRIMDTCKTCSHTAAGAEGMVVVKRFIAAHTVLHDESIKNHYALFYAVVDTYQPLSKLTAMRIVGYRSYFLSGDHYGNIPDFKFLNAGSVFSDKKAAEARASAYDPATRKFSVLSDGGSLACPLTEALESILGSTKDQADV